MSDTRSFGRQSTNFSFQHFAVFDAEGQGLRQKWNSEKPTTTLYKMDHGSTSFENHGVALPRNQVLTCSHPTMQFRHLEVWVTWYLHVPPHVQLQPLQPLSGFSDRPSEQHMLPQHFRFLKKNHWPQTPQVEELETSSFKREVTQRCTESYEYRTSFWNLEIMSSKFDMCFVSSLRFQTNLGTSPWHPPAIRTNTGYCHIAEYALIVDDDNIHSMP